MNKIQCRICGTSHKAVSYKMPLTCHEKRANAKGQVIDVITGYICLKCTRKELKKKK